MDNYAIRVSYGYDNNMESFAEYLKTPGICERFSIYEHPADDKVSRTHIHVLVMQCSVSTDTLKNKIADALGFRPSGNKEWSFKTKYRRYKAEFYEPVNDNLNIYMCKGKYMPKAYGGETYTEEYFLECKQKYVPMKSDEQKIEIVDGQFIVNDNEQKALTKRQLLHLMVGKYNKDIQPHENEVDPDTLRMRTIRMIGKILVAQGEPIGENKVLDYLDSVRMHCANENWARGVNERFKQRYR